MNHPFASIYDQVPEVHCAGHCGGLKDTCCGPIACTATEARLLDEYDGIRSPWVSIENENVRMDWTQLTDFRCPHLSVNGRCTAYEVRPLICRLWGVSSKLPCPWGCKPKRVLNALQTDRLVDAAAARQRSLT